MNVYKYNWFHPASGKTKTENFNLEHQVEASTITNKFLLDRNAALELVNKWNRISQGTYIYWIY